MATRKRPGAAKRTVAKQEAARKRSAPGKRFVGETADQSARARQDERKKVARMAHAARAAKRVEAARTAGHPKKARPHSKAGRAAAAPRTAREAFEAGSAFRAAEEDAALRGAEVEPLASSGRPGTEDLAAQAERPSLHLLPGAAERATPAPAFEPSVDVSDPEGAIGEASPPPLGW